MTILRKINTLTYEQDVEIACSGSNADRGAYYAVLCSWGPRLAMLHVDQHLSNANEPAQFSESHGVCDQLPLLQLITADLQELGRYLTADVIDVLEAVSAELMLASCFKRCRACARWRSRRMTRQLLGVIWEGESAVTQAHAVYQLVAGAGIG